MKILITGASGLIGTALKSRLKDSGHKVFSLTRRKSRRPEEIYWDPIAGILDKQKVENFDAVINLAGASINKPWTRHHIEQMYASRISATKLLVNSLKDQRIPPKVFISGSAAGYYGDSGDKPVTEADPVGSGILANICELWEAEANKASAFTRVVNLRTGLVFSNKGGVLGPILPGIKLGITTYLGPGDNWWPWVTLEDEIRVIEFLLKAPISGPVNVVAPREATMQGAIKELSNEYKTNFTVRVPEDVLKKTLGNFADELIMGSQRVRPQKLEEAGFQFLYPKLEDAIYNLKLGAF
ncbi:MAG: TIGR01777 family oxidoreductase [Micrococcaceae bacterium]